MLQTISIIIPVYEEHDTLPVLLEQLMPMVSGASPQTKRNIEIIVSDGHPLGTTIARIKMPYVKKILAPKGRASQMNAGASISNGDILLFLHADTFLPPNAFQQIRAACTASRIVAGAFMLGIDAPDPIFRLIEHAVFHRSRLIGIPYGDQAIFVKQWFFNKIGGYKNIPLMEDVDLMQRTRASGGKVKILAASTRTSPRRWHAEGIVFCTLRNWLLVSLYLLGVSPHKLAKFYP